MFFKVAEFDRFPGHRLEDRKVKNRGSMNLSVMRSTPRSFQAGVSWSWLELNCAGLWPSRNWVWDHRAKLYCITLYTCVYHFLALSFAAMLTGDLLWRKKKKFFCISSSACQRTVFIEPRVHITRRSSLKRLLGIYSESRSDLFEWGNCSIKLSIKFHIWNHQWNISFNFSFLCSNRV